VSYYSALLVNSMLRESNKNSFLALFKLQDSSKLDLFIFFRNLSTTLFQCQPKDFLLSRANHTKVARYCWMRFSEPNGRSANPRVLCNGGHSAFGIFHFSYNSWLSLHISHFKATNHGNSAYIKWTNRLTIITYWTAIIDSTSLSEGSLFGLKKGYVMGEKTDK